jgi:hypothetical protein
VRAEGRHGVTDEVDAAVERVELSRCDPLVNCPRTEAYYEQLLAANHTALASRDLGDPVVDLPENVTLVRSPQARGGFSTYMCAYSPLVAGGRASVAFSG